MVALLTPSLRRLSMISPIKRRLISDNRLPVTKASICFNEQSNAASFRPNRLLGGGAPRLQGIVIGAGCIAVQPVRN